MTPDLDECEITIFGTGHGESIVIHIGQGKWIIVDSCLSAETKRPVALEYLTKLGVNVAQDVCLVMATHWHEDHIRGLSDLFKECKAADFVLPAAITTTVVQSLAGRARNSPNYKKTGIFELTEIFLEIANRKNSNIQCECEFALSDRNIPLRTSVTLQSRLLALSPGNTVYHSYAEESTGGHLTHVNISESNDVSCAAWLEVEDNLILLGADLEEDGTTNAGWGNVVSRFKGRLKNATFFKIPHHGSHGSHNIDVWKEFLTPHPISALTAYSRGVNSPPLASDISRIAKLSGKLYFTGRKNHATVSANASNKHLSAAGVIMKNAPYYSIGKLTCRRKKGSHPLDWKVTTDGRASQIA